MKKVFVLTWVVFIAIQTIFAQNDPAQKARLEKHLYYFAADSLNGRKAGSEDNKKVAAYIKNEFEKIGLNTSYQYILDDSTEQNVIGVLEGNDPILKNEVIVIGAHYDHLGVSTKESIIKIYNGADDNASGTSAIIEIARQMYLKKDLLKRTVIFIAFDAEESGLIGSSFYIKDFNAKNSDQRVVLMMSLDMIGYLKQADKLKISGVKTVKDYKSYFNQVPFDKQYKLVLEDFDNSIFTGSDHGPFLNHKIPAFHVTTGLKSPYHKPEDDADLIDYDGLSILVDYFTSLNFVFATAPKIESSGEFGNAVDKPRPSYFGLTANIGTNQHFYKNGHMTGKKGLDVSAGLYGKVGLGKSFALKGELDYEFKISNRNEGQLLTHAATVPVTLFVRGTFQNVMEFSAGFGGYYSYYFAGSMNDSPLDFSIYTPHEYGGILEMEMRLSKTLIGLQWKFAFNEVMKNPINSDLSKLRGVNFKIGFIF